MGPSEAGYWDLRPEGAAHPDQDPLECYLLAHARMIDAQERIAAAGRHALIVEWELPAAAGDRSERADAMVRLIELEELEMSAVVADEDGRGVSARALVVGADVASASAQAAAISARIGAALDRPGSRLRPPRLRHRG